MIYIAWESAARGPSSAEDHKPASYPEFRTWFIASLSQHQGEWIAARRPKFFWLHFCTLNFKMIFIWQYQYIHRWCALDVDKFVVQIMQLELSLLVWYYLPATIGRYSRKGLVLRAPSSSWQALLAILTFDPFFHPSSPDIGYFILISRRWWSHKSHFQRDIQLLFQFVGCSNNIESSCRQRRRLCRDYRTPWHMQLAPTNSALFDSSDLVNAGGMKFSIPSYETWKALHT